MGCIAEESDRFEPPPSAKVEEDEDRLLLLLLAMDAFSGAYADVICRLLA